MSSKTQLDYARKRASVAKKEVKQAIAAETARQKVVRDWQVASRSQKASILAKLARHKDREVRQAVALNRSTPTKALRALARDGSRVVRASALDALRDLTEKKNPVKRPAKYMKDLHRRQTEAIEKALVDLRERWAKKNPAQAAIVRRKLAALKLKLKRGKNPIPAALARFAASVAAGYVGAKAAKKAAAKKANPKHASPKARKVYAMFHGTKPRKKTIYKATRARLPGKDFAKIGDLISLTVGNHKVSFEKDKVAPIVVTDAKAQKLFLLGGNQNLSALKPVNMAPPGGLHDMGELSQIEYYSRKKFDDFRPTIYFHDLGEENGVRPRLMYDPKARQMYIAGGDYKIKAEGIVN
jgi:hypothetical protein